MKKILLVEDKQEYASAAQKYLGARDYTITHVRDYTEAMVALQERRYDGIVTDCFFPEATGSRKIELGKKLLDEILELKIKLLTNKEESDIVDVTRRVNPVIEYGKKAMIEDEANQPLGVLIGQEADRLGTPFVMATSSYHHDTLTTPVHWYIQRDMLPNWKSDELFMSDDEQKINEYCSKLENMWKLVDCGPGSPESKASEEFWVRVHTELEARIAKTKNIE